MREKIGFLVTLLIVALLSGGCTPTTTKVPTTPFSGVLAPDAGTLNPPKGTVMPEVSDLESIEEALEKVSVTLLVTFKDAKLLTADQRQVVTLVYQNNSQELDLQQIKLTGPMEPPTQEHKPVQVRGKAGYFVSFSDSENHALVWEEGGSMISLSGPFSQAELMKIADGLTPYETGD
jgi:hypothetical protein